MKAKLFFLIFLSFFLFGCNTIDSLHNEKTELSNKIGQEEVFRIDQAAGATHATKKILETSPNDDPHTAAARKSVDIADKALPPLSIEDKSRWDEIAEKLILGDSAELKKVEKELISSENKQSELKKKLEETTNELFLFYEERQRNDELRIAEAESKIELQKDLVKYFFAAAAICAIAGAVLTWLMGFKVGLNAFIAAGFFSLAAYLISQTWFAYIAAGIAIISFCGIGFYVWGRLRPEKTMAKTADVLEKMEKSPEGHKSAAAKLVKKEIGNSLSGKEADAHKKYIKEVKKKKLTN
jgi:hypothetical protein